jgi:hypothetical protein
MNDDIEWECILSPSKVLLERGKGKRAEMMRITFFITQQKHTQWMLLKSDNVITH